jgi:predicted nucleic acid-binding protein
MNDVAFFDTNIFLYARDRRDPLKQTIATETLLAVDKLVISTQVVQEFYAAATRKLCMDPSDAAAATEALCNLEMVTIGRVEILRAIRMERQYRISFWDALIVSAAETAGATILFTEDLAHGQRFGAIQIVNPFHTVSS